MKGLESAKYFIQQFAFRKNSSSRLGGSFLNQNSLAVDTDNRQGGAQQVSAWGLH